MVSADENRLLTQSGPGTPGGDVLRRYWQPAALTAELDSDRPVVPVRLMGEDLVLFTNLTSVHPDGELVARHAEPARSGVPVRSRSTCRLHARAAVPPCALRGA